MPVSIPVLAGWHVVLMTDPPGRDDIHAATLALTLGRPPLCFQRPAHPPHRGPAPFAGSGARRRVVLAVSESRTQPAPIIRMAKVSDSAPIRSIDDVTSGIPCLSGARPSRYAAMAPS